MKTEIGFNPIPSISLGDSERILELASENICSSHNDEPHNIDDIIQKFMIDQSIINMDKQEADCYGLDIEEKALGKRIQAQNEIADAKKAVEEQQEMMRMQKWKSIQGLKGNRCSVCFLVVLMEHCFLKI